ncbi:MAG: hypothetical protein AAB565_01235, partial [Patescibacteria group bacterium]
MIEKDLIAKLQELKRIEPQKDWVFLAKRQILADENLLSIAVGNSSFSFFNWLFLKPRPALISLVVLGLLISTFSFAQNSLPGDLSYPLKRITEKSQAIFVSDKEKSNFTLGITEKRLE